MDKHTVTNVLLAAIAVLLGLNLLVFGSGADAHAQANRALQAVGLMGCHLKFTGSTCTWMPVLVDEQGRMLTSAK